MLGLLKKAMSMFRRGDLPEPPPEDVRRRGMNPDYTVKHLPTLAEVDAYCRANHVSANDAYQQRDFLACVIPDRREVVLPAPGVLRDHDKEAALQAHEFAHTWGLVHHDGKGWFPSPQQASQFDWSKAMAKQGVFSRSPNETGK